MRDTVPPNILYLGVKRKKYDVGVTANHASLARGDLATQMITFFQLCVLAHVAVIEVYH